MPRYGDENEVSSGGCYEKHYAFFEHRRLQYSVIDPHCNQLTGWVVLSWAYIYVKAAQRPPLNPSPWLDQLKTLRRSKCRCRWMEEGMRACMLVSHWLCMGMSRQLALDFYDIFQKSHVAMAVVAIDGRLLEVNEEFTRVTGNYMQ